MESSTSSMDRSGCVPVLAWSFLSCPCYGCDLVQVGGSVGCIRSYMNPSPICTLSRVEVCDGAHFRVEADDVLSVGKIYKLGTGTALCISRNNNEAFELGRGEIIYTLRALLYII